MVKYFKGTEEQLGMEEKSLRLAMRSLENWESTILGERWGMARGLTAEVGGGGEEVADTRTHWGAREREEESMSHRDFRTIEVSPSPGWEDLHGGASAQHLTWALAVILVFWLFGANFGKYKKWKALFMLRKEEEKVMMGGPRAFWSVCRELGESQPCNQRGGESKSWQLESMRNLEPNRLGLGWNLFVWIYCLCGPDLFGSCLHLQNGGFPILQNYYSGQRRGFMWSLAWSKRSITLSSLFCFCFQKGIVI